MDRYAPLILPYVVRYDSIPKRFWNVQLDQPQPPGDMGSSVNPEPVKEESRAPSTDNGQGTTAKRKRELDGEWNLYDA